MPMPYHISVNDPSLFDGGNRWKPVLKSGVDGGDIRVFRNRFIAIMRWVFSFGLNVYWIKNDPTHKEIFLSSGSWKKWRDKAHLDKTYTFEKFKNEIIARMPEQQPIPIPIQTPIQTPKPTQPAPVLPKPKPTKKIQVPEQAPVQTSKKELSTDEICTKLLDPNQPTEWMNDLSDHQMLLVLQSNKELFKTLITKINVPRRHAIIHYVHHEFWKDLSLTKEDWLYIAKQGKKVHEIDIKTLDQNTQTALKDYFKDTVDQLSPGQQVDLGFTLDITKIKGEDLGEVIDNFTNDQLHALTDAQVQGYLKHAIEDGNVTSEDHSKELFTNKDGLRRTQLMLDLEPGHLSFMLKYLTVDDLKLILSNYNKDKLKHLKFSQIDGVTKGHLQDYIQKTPDVKNKLDHKQKADFAIFDTQLDLDLYTARPRPGPKPIPPKA